MKPSYPLNAIKPAMPRNDAALIVTGNGKAVLPSLDAAARGPELDRGARPPRGPAGDHERDPDHDQEQRERQVHGAPLLPRPARSRTAAARRSNTLFAFRM